MEEGQKLIDKIIDVFRILCKIQVYKFLLKISKVNKHLKFFIMSSYIIAGSADSIDTAYVSNKNNNSVNKSQIE